MIKDGIIELAQEAGWEMPVEWDATCLSYNDGFLMRLKRFAALLESKVRADERNALLTALEKLRDESHTIQGASDDYKQGREMGIQLCINGLTRGEK